MPKKNKVRTMKPVKDNGKANSPLQFNIKKDNEQNKKVKPKDVFEYNKK
tara:strand:- start:799 stop:945 length:147 start_codon:yes stop_codon:yes gene_type:complete